MLSQELPNEFRFLIEEIYPEIKELNPEIYTVRTGFWGLDTDICWVFDRGGKRVEEFTPANEVKGWPIGDNQHYEYLSSESILKEHYKKVDNELRISCCIS
jgi:hypothetical protein